jgi:4-aminobutyrate aminotransferase-like enzyme
MQETHESLAEQAARARKLHAEYVLPAVKHYYAEPLVPESAAGLVVRDVEGKEYLDFFGGILTISIGHCDERVTGPLKAQIDRLGHISTLYPSMPMAELAETLARITPGRLKRSMFTNSGSEADETAVMLAQVYTGAQELIGLRHGYAGRTFLAQTLTAQAPWRGGPTPVAAVKQALAPYCYRCPLKLTYPSCDVACAADIEELIQTTTTGRIAGFLAEPIQGVGGFVTPPVEYFERAVEIVRRHGGVFICDEVQTGFGRLGKLFGIEHWGVEPEIMTMAKGIANGMPLGVTIATEEIAQAFQKLTLSTFGGNPLSCTAANATIGVIEGEDLASNAARQGARLREGLERLQRRHARLFGDVRGMGLMQGVELVEDRKTKKPAVELTARLFEATRERGLLIGKGGMYGNVLRLSPPMIVEESEIDGALDTLDQAFAAATK